MNEDNAFQRSNDLLDTGAEAYRNGDYLTAQKYYTTLKQPSLAMLRLCVI